MKHRNQKIIPISAAYRHYNRPYPNAADPQYFLHKVLDGIIAFATGMGCVTVFFFLATI